MREVAALILALAAAAVVDRLAARRGFDLPGFRDPARRLVVGLGLALVFFLGVFYPAAVFDQEIDVDLEAVSPIQLFFSQLLLVGWLALWWRLGSVARRGDIAPAPQPGLVPPAPLGGTAPSAALEGDSGVGAGSGGEEAGGRMAWAWADQLGLSARDVGAELSVGLAAGVVGWLGVLSAALLMGLLVTKAGGEHLLSQEPAEQIVWLASLPVGLRLGVALAAGTVEELFFRGFLQPRIGIALSTALFVGAHLAYGELFMLFGVSLLSLYYAWLVAWRRSIWAAMAAHFLFDAVQLLVIIPAVLKALD